MALCQECSSRNTCKDICNALKKEITGRGKTASRKPKTYLVDYSHIEDCHQSINGFQKKVLHAIAELSMATGGDPIRKLAIEEAIDVGLNENEKRIIKLL